MKEKEHRIWQRTYLYVQPLDYATNNFLIDAIPDNSPRRGPEDGMVMDCPFSIFRVSADDLNCFFEFDYLVFSVYTRKENDERLKIRMRKTPEIEERNMLASRRKDFTLVLVSDENVEVLIKEKIQARNLAELPYLIYPKDNSKTKKITIAHIRSALLKCKLPTQSLRESRKMKEREFETIWRADEAALTMLYRDAQNNELIHFVAYHSPHEGYYDFHTVVITQPPD